MKEIFSFVCCQGMWKSTATPQATGPGPQTDQPPPEMNNLPSAT